LNSTIKPRPIVINHQGMFPSVTISFNLQPGMALGNAVAAIQQIEKETGKRSRSPPPFQGKRTGVSGVALGNAAADRAALIVIYIILGVLYESAIHPITILSNAAFAGIGALLLLMAVHMESERDRHDRHHPADRHRQEERHHAGRLCPSRSSETEGLGPEESIYRACIMRFRPILMTTMAALLGGVPLMLGTGTGSEIRQPLGYAIVGGLALSQVADALHDAGRFPLSRPAHPTVAAPRRARWRVAAGVRATVGGLAAFSVNRWGQAIDDLAACRHPHRLVADLERLHDLRLVWTT